jgi:GR25 family glycosyltransferase involved in LPS biosynthesis
MKAFVISLSKIDSSITSAKVVLSKLLEYGFQAELFEGTYGDEAVRLFKLEKRELSLKGIKTSRDENLEVTRSLFTKKEAAKFRRPGVLGCFYSHYRLWKKCLELNEPIFIFEDDVIFQRNYIPVKWKEVLLVCTGKMAHKHRHYSTLLYEPSGKAFAFPLRNSSMPGAVGYGLTPAGAKKLVDAYAVEVLPADTAMNMHVVNLECHSYLMGRAAVAEDGKQSLTSSSIWGKNKLS